MARSRKITTLAELIPKVIKELKKDPRPTREEIEEVWARVAGQKAAKHSWPTKLTRGQLLVEVENSGWMYTLSSQKIHLLQGLIELLGANRIKTLNFRIGEKKDA